MNWTAELAAKIAGQILTDDASRVEVSSDFGRIVERRPAAVARPASSDDVAEVVKFAGHHALGVSVRGRGHSQNGQSLSDQIVLDTRELDHVLQIDENCCTVVCQAGVTWRALVERLMPFGLSPPVLTNNLDVTVGGTLSTGGLGVSSWRHGTQADHCLELEVVTGGGEQLRCSARSNPELLDAVRAGNGWYGVITEATLQLRRHKPHFRSFNLLYDDLSKLLADLKTLMEEERFDYLESWCVPLPQGLKKVDGQRQPFAEWFFPLHCTSECDGSAGLEEKLAGLNYYKHVHTEDGNIEEFFVRLDPLFDLWKAGGFWDCAHPWMESILPWDGASFYIRQALERIPPQLLTGGHILLWPARGRATAVPYLCRPDEEYAMGFGILPAVPDAFLTRTLPRLKQASQAATQLGGKRYLSGWLDFDATEWKAHYGIHWAKINELKRRYDPLGIFGGFPKTALL